MRPQTLSDYIGQQHLLQTGKPLYDALAAGQCHSMILWGPPGTGKTTLARMAANTGNAELIGLSAVLAGVKDIRAAVERARLHRETTGRDSILFIDEVHRFNKSQQDAFLPHIEDGTIIFIGATTENPSFSLNNALLSRARVYVLKALSSDDLVLALQRAAQDAERGLGRPAASVTAEALTLMAQAADGDARRALNLLELCDGWAAAQGIEQLDATVVGEVANSAATQRRFDNGGDAFYEQISALHKAVRGSDPDAALYWLCRMLDGGCDALYIARRVVRMASEDIGNADPRALRIALDAWEAQERLGSPEGELAIAQAVSYLACAAKSNAVYKAFGAAMQDARGSGSLEVPVHLRNAPTKLMQELGYGHAYRYAHDEPEGYAAGEHYFPDDMPRKRYYAPVSRGLESKIQEKLARLAALDEAYAKSRGGS